MPKATKLKMNVRHGEVKLAENTVNLDATLSYTRLHATTIDGSDTNVVASFSPMVVDRWNYGNLNTHFSEDIALKDVGVITLSLTSSDVTIDRLLNSAEVKNNLGALRINSVSDNFSNLDVAVQNGELRCELPSTAFVIEINGKSSKLTSPAELILEKTKNQNSIIHKGYFKNKNTNKSIFIDSSFSEVVLQE
jgi:hypothetical protein